MCTSDARAGAELGAQQAMHACAMQQGIQFAHRKDGASCRGCSVGRVEAQMWLRGVEPEQRRALGRQVWGRHLLVCTLYTLRTVHLVMRTLPCLRPCLTFVEEEVGAGRSLHQRARWRPQQLHDAGQLLPLILPCMSNVCWAVCAEGQLRVGACRRYNKKGNADSAAHAGWATMLGAIACTCHPAAHLERWAAQ